MAWGYPNWMRAISAWYNEIDLYIYGKDPDTYLGEGGWREIGHYTQVYLSVTIM